MMLDILRRNAEHYGSKTAIIYGKESVSYTDLLNRVMDECERLTIVEGVVPHTLYQLISSQDISYVVKFFALHVIKAICVPVETKSDMLEYSDERVSDILFTTGSTSNPKGVMLSWDAVMADTENLIEAHRYHEALTFVICGPLHHFGSWSKVLPTIVSGGTLYLLDGLKDPELLFSALESSPRTATFLVPSAIRMLLQLNRDRLTSLADNIEFIETGAAPLAAYDMEALRHLLPHTRLYNTYASTETGVVCTYPFHLPSAEPDSAPGRLDEQCLERCVGPTMLHAHLRLVEGGRIAVSGRMIMTGYLHEPTISVNEVVTSDIGELDERGRLYLVGRESDFINVGGLKVSPVEIEACAMAISWVKDCICIAHPHPMMGQVPELLVVTNDKDYDRKTIIAHLKQHLEQYKIPLFYRKVDSIKKTFNGKTDRKYYQL